MIQVEAEGEAVGHLEQKQFVGSMAFNRFIQASPSASPAATAVDLPDASATSSSVVDGSTIASPTENVTITSDNNSADGGSGSGSGSEITAAPASLGDRNKDKVDNDFTVYGEDFDGDDDVDLYVVGDSSYTPGGGGVFEEAKEVALNVLRRDSIVGNIAMAQSFVLDAEGHRRHGVGEMERSGTTVKATTEVRIELPLCPCCAAVPGTFSSGQKYGVVSMRSDACCYMVRSTYFDVSPQHWSVVLLLPGDKQHTRNGNDRGACL